MITLHKLTALAPPFAPAPESGRRYPTTFEVTIRASVRVVDPARTTPRDR